MKQIVTVLLLLLSVNLNFTQPKEKSANKYDSYNVYLNLIDKHYNAQVNLLNEIDYFKLVRNKNYVLKGQDLKKINLQSSKIISLLEQSINFEANIEVSKKLTNDLIYTHLRIKTFETFILQQKILGESIKISNLINEDSKLYQKKKNCLNNLSNIIISHKYRKSLINQWQIIKKNKQLILKNKRNTSLFKKIKSSQYFQDYLKDSKKIHNSKKRYNYLIKQKKSFNKKRGFESFTNAILSGFSKTIGNISGLISLRKGKLLKEKDFIKTITQKLKPLDVILEKTPFKLTDKFIPGYWGHAAIYVGNETQLKELGLWENPFIIKHQKAIKKGACIIEAIRSDVDLRRLNQFTNIDDYAHIRLKSELSLDKKREMIISAFAQIGKKYDFRFDVESSKKLVCTELLYITFEDVDFSTSKNFGRNTISTDKIAEQAFKKGPFNLIDLYLNGVEIDSKNRQQLFEKLINLSNKEIRKIKKNLH